MENCCTKHSSKLESFNISMVKHVRLCGDKHRNEATVINHCLNCTEIAVQNTVQSLSVMTFQC